MITVNQLTVSYHGRVAVRNVSFEAPATSITAMVGPSGCGKTTVLGAINRMTEQSEGATVNGSVSIEGVDVYTPSTCVTQLRRRVGMIFQRPNPFAMSIKQNIQLAPHSHWRMKRSELDELTEQVLRDVGLWDEVKDRLNESALKLSGGQQQRLCIARALALRPDVLLMDEPCSALDPMALTTVEQLIQSLGQRYTVLLVTHNLAQAKRIAEQLVVFWHDGQAGQVIECGNAQQLFHAASSDLAKAYLTGGRG